MQSKLLESSVSDMVAAGREQDSYQKLMNVKLEFRGRVLSDNTGFR